MRTRRKKNTETFERGVASAISAGPSVQAQNGGPWKQVASQPRSRDISGYTPMSADISGTVSMRHSTGPFVHAQDVGPLKQVAAKPRSRDPIGSVSPNNPPDLERDVQDSLASVDRSIDVASAKVLRLERTLSHRSVIEPKIVRKGF